VNSAADLLTGHWRRTGVDHLGIRIDRLPYKLYGFPHISGNLIHDAQIAILMREHGIRQIFTRDIHFHRFSFIETLDPLG
jgi:predicted nucleic acid-binding protein